jgi:hypothetical protein
MQTVSNSKKVLKPALANVGAYFCSYLFISVLEFLYVLSGKYNATISLIAVDQEFHHLQ